MSRPICRQISFYFFSGTINFLMQIVLVVLTSSLHDLSLALLCIGRMEIGKGTVLTTETFVDIVV